MTDRLRVLQPRVLRRGAGLVLLGVVAGGAAGYGVAKATEKK